MTTIHNQSSPFCERVAYWAPRAIFVLIGGYYGLGVAYDWGVMSFLDQTVMPLIKHVGGYAALGAVMPTFQRYSALAVRFTCGALMGLAYDTGEKVAKCALRRFRVAINM